MMGKWILVPVGNNRDPDVSLASIPTGIMFYTGRLGRSDNSGKLPLIRV